MRAQRSTGKDTAQAILVALVVLCVVFVFMLAWPPQLWWRQPAITDLLEPGVIPK
jgi:hypothetical protein